MLIFFIACVSSALSATPLFRFVHAMAAPTKGRDSSPHRDADEERDVIKEAADNLASVRNTLAAIDDLNARWEVRIIS